MRMYLENPTKSVRLTSTTIINDETKSEISTG